MPIVPFSRATTRPTDRAEQRPMPDEPFALMAAAQMHSEGRLVAPTDEKAKQSDERPR